MRITIGRILWTLAILTTIVFIGLIVTGHADVFDKIFPPKSEFPQEMKGLWTVQKDIERVSVDEIVNFEFVHDIVYDVTYFQDGKLHVDFYWWENGVHDKQLPTPRVEVVRQGQPTSENYDAAISQRRHYIRQDMVNWGVDEVIMSIYREGELAEYFSYQKG